MVKIVNGVVVREGEESTAPSLSTSDIQQNASSMINGTITLCGSHVPKWQLLLMIVVSGLLSGAKGAFMAAGVIAVAYLYGQSSGSGTSAGSGMRSMGTRSGANIRGISDLPPPPKSS